MWLFGFTRCDFLVLGSFSYDLRFLSFPPCRISLHALDAIPPDVASTNDYAHSKRGADRRAFAWPVWRGGRRQKPITSWRKPAVAARPANNAKAPGRGLCTPFHPKQTALQQAALQQAALQQAALPGSQPIADVLAFAERDRSTCLFFLAQWTLPLLRSSFFPVPCVDRCPPVVLPI